jgi:hypothetical protein
MRGQRAKRLRGRKVGGRQLAVDSRQGGAETGRQMTVCSVGSGVSRTGNEHKHRNSLRAITVTKTNSHHGLKSLIKSEP